MSCIGLCAALTSLALEHQEEEAWLLPPEMLLLTRLRSLSFAGNDCSRERGDWVVVAARGAGQCMLPSKRSDVLLSLKHC